MTVGKVEIWCMMWSQKLFDMQKVKGVLEMTANISFGDVEYQDYIIMRTFSKELDADVYAINVENIQKEPEAFQNRIPKDRYMKMLKYHNHLDKMLLVGNEILFEYGLRLRFPEIDSGQWKRCVDEAGKPYVEGPEQIYFNMSHAGTYSVCAFSNKPVGVDIEEIGSVDMSIAERHYCSIEYADIMNYRGDSRLKRFYQYWVLKESFTKAVGLGLSIPLNVFSFDDKAHNGLLYVEHSINGSQYLSQQFSFRDSRYEMALCIRAA